MERQEFEAVEDLAQPFGGMDRVSQHTEAAWRWAHQARGGAA
jgi:hypothetical protein